MSVPKPIPDTYRRITPTLIVDGGIKALEFYAEVFGATERMRFPGPNGTLAHAEIQIGDSVVIIEDASRYLGTQAPPREGLAGTPTSLFIYVEDVDATIEQAVKLITSVPAALFGLNDRGVLREGAHADVVVFDLATIASDEPTLVKDLPGDSARLTAGSQGVVRVLVNGVPVVIDGKPTGEVPGTVLRSGRDTSTVSVA